MNPRTPRGVVLLSLGLVVLAAATAHARDVTRTSVRIVGRLDREILTEFELERFMGRRLPPDQKGLPPVAQDALVELVVMKLEAREARARGVKITARLLNGALARRIQRLGGPDRFEAMLRAAPTTIEDVRHGLEDQILIRRLYLQKASGPMAPGKAPIRGRIRPEEARAHFRAHRDRYRSPGRAHVALIEIRAERDEADGGLARAQDVVRRARAGEDFAAMARKQSRGPRSEDGGDLGWVEAGHLDPRIDAFAFDAGAGAGAVSDPIRTARGSWWIVRLIEVERGDPLPFEDVVDRIADDLRTERLTQLRRTVLRRLVSEAVIEPPALRQRILERIETIGEPVRP